MSRRRLERALHRVCRPLSEGGSLALQAGALTPGGYVDLVKPENLLQFSDTEAGEEPEGLEVQVVEQTPWERADVVYSGTTDGSMVRLLHEPQEDTVGMSLRTATQTVGMSLRTVDKTPETEQPGDRCWYVVADCRTNRRHVVADCRQDVTETEQPGVSAGMSLRTASTNRRYVVADCRQDA